MPKGLRRLHGGGERHFITCSCYHRMPFLGSARRRDAFLKILEEVRRQFDFVVWGYVVMDGWPTLSHPFLALTIVRVPHSLRRARSLVLRSEQRVGLRGCPHIVLTQLQ
jgi:hypothetical protein